MTLLKVLGISKQWEGEFTLSDINFSQRRFQKIAIAGETGSGKSTLLKIIAGLVQPNTGQVLFESVKVEGPEEIRPLIEECPDPKDLGSKRSRQTAEVEKRDRQILAEYRKQKSQYPHLSKSNIAARIAKSGKYENVSGRIRRNLTPGTIRRLINRLL